MMLLGLEGAAATVEVRWGVFANPKLHFDAVGFIIDKVGRPYAVQTMLLIQGVIMLAVYLVQVSLETPLFPSYVGLEDVKSGEAP